MRSVLAIVLAVAASPVEARPWQCVLWPNTCQLDQPPAPPEPSLPPPVPVQPAPLPVPVPAPAPPPVVARPPAARPPAKAAPAKRIKSTWAKPKRKPAAMPAWCARVPAGTPLWMVKSAAIRELKRPLTDAEIGQAQACLASKR